MAILVFVMRTARHLLMRDELREEVMLGYISARLDNEGLMSASREKKAMFLKQEPALWLD
jgi:hypothetical protein